MALKAARPQGPMVPNQGPMVLNAARPQGPMVLKPIKPRENVDRTVFIKTDITLVPHPASARPIERSHSPSTPTSRATSTTQLDQPTREFRSRTQPAFVLWHQIPTPPPFPGGA
jgi:hypothetical protein